MAKLASKGYIRTVLSLSLLALPLLAPPAQAQEAFVVPSVEKPADLRLLPATAWPPAESDQGEMLLKLSYLRGVLDALQYVEVAPQSARQALIELKGKNLHQLAAEIDAYYLKDPSRRELPPSAVLLRILPKLNKPQEAGKPAE